MSARRLFFALWPDAAMREELAAVARDAVRSARGARPVALESLHVTLAFLGAVPEASVCAVREIARQVAREGGSAAVRGEPAHAPLEERPEMRPEAPLAAPLDVTLDTLEHWRRAQLLCATGSRKPTRVIALAGRLRAALSAGGFRPDLKPFRPHVTLARQVRSVLTGAPLPTVTWDFDAFALIESRTEREGASYSVVDTWTLCGSTLAAR